MANRIYRRFVAVRSGLRLPHVDPESDDDLPRPADLDNPEVRRLARAYATNVVLYGSGDEGSLRSTATADGSRPSRSRWARTPVPAGAHREGVGGVERPSPSVSRPSRRSTGRVVPLADPPPTAQSGGSAPTPADSSRWVGNYPLSRARRSAPITNHFKTEEHAIEAPSTG